jgi:hypothetical protein
LYRNTLVFAAPDATRLQDLAQAVRDFLAWQSIVRQSDELNLARQQSAQAEAQLRAVESTVLARLPETYQWLLVPEQGAPQAPVTWNVLKLMGTDPLALRASKKLKGEELLFTSLGGTRLRMAMDEVPLWRGQHVPIKQLAQDFASYLYLPRLVEPMVLAESARAGIGLLTWEQDSFAYAEGYDEQAQRYRGLKSSVDIVVSPHDAGLLVKPAAARQQMNREVPTPQSPDLPSPPGGVGPGTYPPGAPTPTAARPTRYHGVVTLDPQRVGRDAGQIASEVVAHLAGMIGATVQVTLEIHADVPEGVPENVVRTVTENARTLKFSQQGFEDS